MAPADPTDRAVAIPPQRPTSFERRLPATPVRRDDDKDPRERRHDEQPYHARRARAKQHTERPAAAAAAAPSPATPTATAAAAAAVAAPRLFA